MTNFLLSSMVAIVLLVELSCPTLDDPHNPHSIPQRRTTSKFRALQSGTPHNMQAHSRNQKKLLRRVTNTCYNTLMHDLKNKNYEE